MTKKNIEQFDEMREALRKIAYEMPTSKQLKAMTGGGRKYKDALEQQYSEAIALARYAVWYVPRLGAERKKPRSKPRLENKKAGVNVSHNAPAKNKC